MAEQEHIPPLIPAVQLSKGSYSVSDPPTFERLIYTAEHPTPNPTPTQYLVKVQAAALTRSELTWPEVIENSYRGENPVVPAHDICGTILSTPQTDEHLPSGPKFKVGDEIFGLLAFEKNGGAADCAVAEEKELAFKPRNVSGAEASAIPLSALTAWQAFFEHGGLEHVATEGEEAEKGEQNQSEGHRGPGPDRVIRVLVTNASGGVGVQAVQLLRSHTLFGTQKFWICGTCSHRNASFVKDELHADAVVDYTVEPDISKAFASREWEPVDLVLDCVGGETLRQAHSSSVLRDKGAVVSVVNTPESSRVDLDEINKRGVKSSFFIVEPNGEQLQKIALLVEKSEERAFVDRVYDLVDAREAMEAVESQRVRGKVVLRVNHT